MKERIVDMINDFFDEFLETDEGYYFCRLLESYFKEKIQAGDGK